MGAALPDACVVLSATSVPSRRTLDGCVVVARVGRYWPVVQSAVAKGISLPITALLGILTSHLIIDSYGVSAFALFGLLSSLPALLAFSDFGVGAAVVNSVSKSSSPQTDLDVQRTILSALRATVLVAILGLSFGGAAWAYDWWPTLLGSGWDDSDLSLAATVAWSTLMLAVPLALGQRIILALHRNYLQIALQTMTPALTVLALLLLRDVARSQVVPTAIASCSSLAIAVASMCLAVALLPGPVRAAVRDLLRVRSRRGKKLISTALPMSVIMICLVLSYESGRIILSQFSGPVAVAEFTLASQFFSPILGFLAAITAALWPIFASSREPESTLIRRVVMISAATGVGAAALGTCLLLLLPWLTSIVADGAVKVPSALSLGFVFLVLSRGMQYVLGYYLMQGRALILQSWTSIGVLLAGVPLSVLLVRPLGSAGPTVAMATAILVLQIIPEWVWLGRRYGQLRAGRPIN